MSRKRERVDPNNPAHLRKLAESWRASGKALIAAGQRRSGLMDLQLAERFNYRAECAEQGIDPGEWFPDDIPADWKLKKSQEETP